MFKFLKSIFVFQDLISWVKVNIPIVLEHNLAKYDAVKKSFYLTALENLEGDYLEFGVFTGSSFACAMRSYRKFKKISDVNTKFFGFDSFTGFGKVTDEDRHWFYLNDTFTINKKKVLRFIKKKAKKVQYKIIEGLFDQTLKKKTCKDLKVKKVRIAFIDCDMQVPAKLALDFIKPGLQEGTIIIMDDFFSYKGSKDKGVAGAFYKFCEENKNFEFRHIFDYGCGGVAFIINRI